MNTKLYTAADYVTMEQNVAEAKQAWEVEMLKNQKAVNAGQMTGEEYQAEVDHGTQGEKYKAWQGAR